MGLFKNNKLWQKVSEKLGQRKEKKRTEDEEYSEEDWANVEYDRSDLDIHNTQQRKEYVVSCLEQMADATKELENLNYEYQKVTSYLKDMEEIEALPDTERRELEECAEKIGKLETKREGYLEKKNRLTDDKYHQMERIEDEAQEACTKLGEAEEYQERIRKDISRLEGEKHAYHFRRDELKQMIADLKGVTIIFAAALCIGFIVLFALQKTMYMDIQMACLITAAIGAVSIILIFLKYSDSVREMKRVENGISRIITLQNTVKIRYVNNVNLLDYLYLKYHVSSAKEMKNLWEKYIVEKEERKKYREAELELDDCQQDFLVILKCCRVKDPAIWLHQTDAILDSKEMVEIRHNLIIRRQSLRRRIDYNKESIAAQAQTKIKELADEYPQYTKEILHIVDQYEKDFA